MSLSLGPKNKSATKMKPKSIGKLRRAQVITTYGSGAIADMPEYSVVMGATKYWSKFSPILHEPNLERLLKVKYFKQPYIDDEDGEPAGSLPAFRFPTMYFCPNCHKLRPYWLFGNGDGKKCDCGSNIVPSRFITACINGHMEDFPYNWWVHRGEPCEKGDQGKDNLEIRFSDRSGGLDSIVITCTACNKSRTMKECMRPEALKDYKCRGIRPWIDIDEESWDQVNCNARMKVLQRGASNVYYSVTASALTIPPWSRKLNQIVDQHWNDRLRSAMENAPTDENLQFFITTSFDEDDIKTYGINAIIDAMKQRAKHEQTGEGYSRQNLYQDEYKVFCLRDYAVDDDPQFRIQSTRTSVFLQGYLDDVIMVRRLREVLALKGFRRITPSKPKPDDDRFAGYHLKDDCVPLSDTHESWLPGIELLGEGIFIRLNEKRLKEWEQRVDDRYRPMKERLEQSNLECDNFSPRYVLLHTLSHLLIRQLTLECGYSGASIKERIYSTYPGSDLPMAGILLYTSSSDSDGSLGGLVRNAEPKQFEKVFRNMLQEASWCSSDPVCIGSMAQGFDSLNYAACHACTLLPETCCERRNCLLDRASVVGTIENGDCGFFHELLMKEE